MIEVTESAWLLDRAVAPAIAELHGAGMTVGLDDFGADFSSLSRLRELPVKVMKIDRAFMTDVPAHPRATAIVAAVLQLAESCGCDVVVEGVETADQLRFLRDHGCSLAQGFHLATPASATRITAMLHESLAPERRSFGAARK